MAVARAGTAHCAPAPPKCNTARKCLGLQLQASLYFAAAERNEQSARLHRERRAQEAAQRLQEVATPTHPVRLPAWHGRRIAAMMERVATGMTVDEETRKCIRHWRSMCRDLWTTANDPGGAPRNVRDRRAADWIQRTRDEAARRCTTGGVKDGAGPVCCGPVKDGGTPR